MRRVVSPSGGKELNSSPFPSALIRFGGRLPDIARPEALREERLF